MHTNRDLSNSWPTVDEEAKAIEKHVDAEFKKLSKRATEEEEDGSKHKKNRKRKVSSTTAAPKDAKSTTSAAKSMSTTNAPVAGSTTSQPGASPTTGKPKDSTTPAPKKDGSTTAASKKGGSSTTKDPIDKEREKQSVERDIIRKIFKETQNWKKWLEANNRKTLNPKAAKVTFDIAEKVKMMVNEKPKRFFGRYTNDW